MNTCNNFLFFSTYRVAPTGSQLDLRFILRVARPCLVAMAYSVRLSVSSRRSCARERFVRRINFGA